MKGARLNARLKNETESIQDGGRRNARLQKTKVLTRAATQAINDESPESLHAAQGFHSGLANTWQLKLNRVHLEFYDARLYRFGQGLRS
jgi:hypothetical protein